MTKNETGPLALDLTVTERPSVRFEDGTDYTLKHVADLSRDDLNSLRAGADLEELWPLMWFTDVPALDSVTPYNARQVADHFLAHFPTLSKSPPTPT